MMPLPVLAPAGPITAGAGFGIRLLARLIDMVAGFVMGITAGILSGLALGIAQIAGAVSPELERRIAEGPGAMGMVLGIVAMLLYHAIMEAMYGASLGKLICQLRVVSQDARPCNLVSALIRGLGFLLDSLFFGLVGHASMGKNMLNQRYGDVWAKTVVVKLKDMPSTARRPIWMGLFGAALGMGVCIIVVALWPLLLV